MPDYDTRHTEGWDDPADRDQWKSLTTRTRPAYLDRVLRTVPYCDDPQRLPNPDLTIEASTLGLPPGVWPITVGWQTPTDTALESKVYERRFAVAHPSDRSDLLFVRYIANDGSILDVLND